MPRINVALATSRDHPDLPDDDRILARALLERGVAVRPLVWDGGVAPELDEVVVLRATWDYHHDALRFVHWVQGLARAGTRVINIPSLVVWNADKRYLGDLARARIPTIPTVVHAGSETFARWRTTAPWSDVVIKPAVSASGYLTERFAIDDERALDHVAQIVALGREALVQPFVDAVMTDGERSYVMIGSAFTHCVWRPPFGRGSVEAEAAARCVEPRADELELARRTLRALPSAPVYARIDIVRYDDAPVLSEAELIEPSLYFGLHPPAATALAERIIAFCAERP